MEWQTQPICTTNQNSDRRRSAQQKARDWLQGVADEEDNVKDLVMQELWKKEDFPNT
jgi:hypothetical protein